MACFTVFCLSACSRSDVPNEAASATSTSPAPEAGNLAAEKATQEITAEFMRDIIIEISDDKYEGRGPGSRGDVAARKYLAEELEKLGLEPAAADGD